MKKKMARRNKLHTIPLRKIRNLSLDIQKLLENNKYGTVDVEQLVHDLRSYKPRYAKFEKYPFFTKRVKQITGSLSTKTENKRPRRDEKLELNEAAQDVKSSNDDSPYNGTGSSSILDSDASSGEVKNSFDEEASMSNETTTHDVMSSTLMNGYLQQSNKSSGQKMELESRELDMVKVKSRMGKKATIVGDGSTTGKNNDISSVSDGNQSKGPMFKDLGGMSELIQDLKMDVVFPFNEPDMLQHLGVEPFTGILLHGPPGCGKTRLAHAIANECNVPFYNTSATDLVSGDQGQSEEKIGDLFSKAYRTAPSVIFIDEIDVIASKRENLQRETDRRFVTQLMTCMNTVNRNNANSESCHGKAGYVLVIGATNRPDAIDSALRRPGRFDREFFIDVPDENTRFEILPLVTRKLKLDGSVDLRKIARSTPGFVGADLDALAKMAGRLALRRILLERKNKLTVELVNEEKNKYEEKDKLCITMDDFEDATKLIQPSTKREGFSAIPNVTWDDVGGLISLREGFSRDIVRRIKNPEACQAVKLELDVGFMLYGPPGCGKTLIAKAVANEAGASFMYIKGPELLSKFVGDSEKTVRTIFERAFRAYFSLMRWTR